VGIFVGNNIPKMSVLYVNILYTCTYTISQKSFVYVKILGHWLLRIGIIVGNNISKSPVYSDFQADPFAPRGEPLLPFPPRSENIIERARGQEGRRGVGGWVRTSCKGRQTQTVSNKHTTSGKASALVVLRKEVLGIKVLCAPGPAVQGRSARAPSPALPQHRPWPRLARCSVLYWVLCSL